MKKTKLSSKNQHFSTSENQGCNQNKSPILSEPICHHPNPWNLHSPGGNSYPPWAPPHSPRLPSTTCDVAPGRSSVCWHGRRGVERPTCGRFDGCFLGHTATYGSTPRWLGSIDPTLAVSSGVHLVEKVVEGTMRGGILHHLIKWRYRIGIGLAWRGGVSPSHWQKNGKNT